MKIKNPVAACHVAWSLVLRREGRELEALGHTEKAFRACRIEPPSDRAPVLLNAYFADLCERTGRADEAYEAARTVVIQLNEINYGGRKAWPSRPQDQWFLLYWMKYILGRVAADTQYDARSLAISIPATSAQLDMPETAKILKSMFVFDLDWAADVDLSFEVAVDEVGGQEG
ncbi:MAG: hypothetical protein Q8R97_00925 [Brevundimonas sp.]|jgi:hypothetical protein|nr:hypothetical protein [Brevundimonas sp.]MDZ4061511.1 hypothetical protein [Brevundimonas sp.]